jgi:hypothetical protein
MVIGLEARFSRLHSLYGRCHNSRGCGTVLEAHLQGATSCKERYEQHGSD